MNTLNVKCSACGSKWKKAHKPTCNRSKKKVGTGTFIAPQATAPQATPVPVASTPIPIAQMLGGYVPAPVAALPRTIVNRIALVVDASGSMAHLTSDVKRMIDEQILNIKTQSANHKQKAYISLYYFNTTAKPQFVNSYCDSLQGSGWGNGYSPYDGTALLDAMNKALDDSMQPSPYKGDLTREVVDESHLIITITDGQENASSMHGKSTAANRVKVAQQTGKYTFAFNVPQGDAHYIQTFFGIPKENVREWETTSKGMGITSTMNSVGTQGYYSARSVGATMSTNFYQPDLSGLSSGTLQKKLIDRRHDFKSWKVDKEVDITSFVNSHLRAPEQYAMGKAFYTLSKDEDVQEGKQLILRDNSNGNVYNESSQDIRSLINMPTTGTIRVKPGNHSHYTLFVQSTSSNRKLVRGTELLYRVR